MAIDLVDTIRAAKLLGVSEATLRNWRKNCTGPVYLKFGDSEASPVRYRESDIEAWIEERAKKQARVPNPSPDEVF